MRRPLGARAAGPLAGPEAAARVLPFALVALAGIAISGLPAWSDLTGLLAAAGLTALVVLAALRVPWHRMRPSAQSIVPLAFYLVVVLLRAAGGGTDTSAGTLCLLPVCWLGLYGRRPALLGALGATFAVFAGPALLVGGPHYPRSDVLRGASLALVAALVGYSVQRLVSDLDDERTAATATAARIAAVAALMHDLPDDTRAGLCRGTRRLAGATGCALLEARGDLPAALTAADGGGLPGLARPGLGPSARDRPKLGPSAPDRQAAAATVARVLASGQPVLVSQVRPPAPGAAPEGAPGRAAVLYQPVPGRDRAVAVLVVGWDHPVGLADAEVSVVGLIAAQAAGALERADLMAALTRTARTDGLTGVPNRRAWDERLALEVGRARHAGPLSVAILDLDHFKGYNDTHGHPAGDQVLRDAALAWSSRLRSSDVLARYGGEEFTVLLPGCSLAAARGVLEKLCRATPHGQTVSAGVAQWDGQESVAELLRRADAALYAAKAAGRGRIHAARATPAARRPARRAGVKR